MNIKSINVLALIPTLLIGARVFAESNTLTFSGECTAEIFLGSSETQSFSVQDNERVKMRFRTVGVSTDVYADLTPAGKAILGYEYFIWQASNSTIGESSLEAAKPGDKLNLHTLTHGGNPDIKCSGIIQ